MNIVVLIYIISVDLIHIFYFCIRIIFLEKTNFTRKGDIELKRRKYCFSIYNNFLSSLFFDCLWIRIFFFIILFHILICKNTHSYSFWWEKSYGSIFYGIKKSIFTIILNTSNTYSTDCESSFLFHIMNYISSWSCNRLWISDMNSLIYVKFRWIIIE